MAFKKLKVKVGQVTGTHTNFPTLIQPSLITGLGSITLAEAQSARFYSDVGKTTEIAREIVSADEIHVKVTSMEALAEIWMDYDGIRSDYAVGATYGRNAVWTDYEYVNHYQGSGTAVVNSAGNNDGVASNTAITGSAGYIGNGLDLTAGDYDVEASYTTPNDTSRQYTMSIWFKTNDTATGFIVLAAVPGGPDQAMAFSGSKVYLRVMGGTPLVLGTVNQYRDNAWHKLTIIKTGASTAKGRIDGVDAGSIGVGSFDRGGTIWVGSRGTSYFDGFADEWTYRYSSVSDAFDTTEYNNQNANGSFWEATDAGGGGSTPAQAARRGVIMM